MNAVHPVEGRRYRVRYLYARRPSEIVGDYLGEDGAGGMYFSLRPHYGTATINAKQVDVQSISEVPSSTPIYSGRAR